MRRAIAARSRGAASFAVGARRPILGARRARSPVLACDPSSEYARASAAKLRPALQWLRGRRSRTRVPSVPHDCRLNAAVLRLTRRGEIAERRSESWNYAQAPASAKKQNEGASQSYSRQDGKRLIRFSEHCDRCNTHHP